MFKTAISLRLVDIISTSLQLLRICGRNLNPLSGNNNSGKYHTVLTHLLY